MTQQTWTAGDTGAAIRTIIDDNFSELYQRDAAGYGFAPSATAAVNVAAMQAALDVGGIITVNTPGTYELNDTLKIGSNTKLICCPGVIFKKTGNYSNVLINKGSETRTYNENIEIDGLTIEVNEISNIIDLDVAGLRAQVGFYYVKHLVFKNFKCEDIYGSQFCIQMARWEDVYFNNITIKGDKDGIDLGVGNNGLFENVNLTTYDDGIALYGAGFPSATIEVGDVYDLTFRNCTDYVHSGVGYTCRMMTGSWDDWTNGNTYKTGDLCTNVGSIYISNNDTGFSAVAANAPVHSSGEVTGADDGITWKYCNDDSIKSYNIYNITFDNLTCYDVRAVIDVTFLDGIWMRSVYPGTENVPYVKDIKLINSVIKGPAYIANAKGNWKSLTIANCVLVDLNEIIRTTDVYADSNDEFKIVFTGNTIRDTTGTLISSTKDGQLIYMVASGNVLDNSAPILWTTGTATIRLINTDMQIPHVELSDITPTVGDICMTSAGFNVYKSAGWVNLAV